MTRSEICRQAALARAAALSPARRQEIARLGGLTGGRAGGLAARGKHKPGRPRKTP